MSTLRNARFATLMAVALALVLTGVVAGAAGQALVLGIANYAGSSSTSLTTNSTGPAFRVIQNGSGKALRAESSQAAPLALVGPSNQPPMTVNSSDRVLNLNADQLDGLDSRGFLHASSYRIWVSTEIQPSDTWEEEAVCDPGDRMVTGGYATWGGSTKIVKNHPSQWDRWLVSIVNISTSTIEAAVVVHCADRPPLHEQP
jgi:hypothetical protein